MKPVGVAHHEATNATEQVWAAEEEYWRYVQSHDWQHYMALWSDDFVGWPTINDHPILKTDISLQIQSGWLSRVIGYELQRESVEAHEQVVIAFYRVKIRLRSAHDADSTTTSRIMHTWMKLGDVWQIVGGMSADDSAL